MPERKFTDFDAAQEAARKPKGLLIGITGPQFSGKSYSAGRLATGAQRVVGGQIYWVDTENDRALELAPYFKFRHVPFPQPKEPKEYEAVVRYCLAKPDCGVIVLDQCTHEHVALLDMRDEFLERKAGDDWQKREKLSAASLVLPKAQRKRFEELVAYGAIRADGQKVPMILLYRAVDKSVPGKSKAQGGDGNWVHKGWQAETTSTLPYFMTARFLLPPGSDGHPNLNPDTEWEKLSIRNPQQFRDWFKPGFQLDEATGEKLARWAMGQTTGPVNVTGDLKPPAEANGVNERLFDRGKALLEEIDALLKRHLTPEERRGKRLFETLELAFATRSWSQVSKLPAADLAVGLAALRRNFEGLADMMEPEPERIPGED